MKMTKEQKEKRNAFRDCFNFRLEAGRAWQRISKLSAAPLIERQKARKDWIEAMKNPAMIEERVSWLFNGSYGADAYYAACLIMCMTAGANKVAQLGALLAGLDWNCPADFARDGWSRLTPDEQAAVNQAVERAAAEGFKMEVLGEGE
jgi:hypothetical protein